LAATREEAAARFSFEAAKRRLIRTQSSYLALIGMRHTDDRESDGEAGASGQPDTEWTGIA